MNLYYVKIKIRLRRAILTKVFSSELIIFLGLVLHSLSQIPDVWSSIRCRVTVAVPQFTAKFCFLKQVRTFRAIVRAGFCLITPGIKTPGRLTNNLKALLIVLHLSQVEGVLNPRLLVHL